MRIAEGGLAGCRRVAIYLVFPSDGLQPSHFSALRYIASSGYAPLVVSNLPLSEGDRAVMLPHCWRLIERPNYGYDFGGYRDGVLFLEDQLAELDKLALLNDSAWFPLPGGEDWLKQAEALDVDFAGAASNYGIGRVQAIDYETIEWRYVPSHKNFHHCSFALLIGRSILGDAGFKRYWRGFRLSRDKKRTVRRGEIGLTQWVIKRGYSHADTLDITSLDDELRALSDDRITEVLDRLIIPEDARLRGLKHGVREAAQNRLPGWRERTEKIILTSVARQGVSYVLTEFTTKERRFPFLKKSPVWLSSETSDITLAIAEDLSGPLGAEITSEIGWLRKQRR